jgi:hypothetical protein
MAKQTTKTKQTATKTITYESLNTWNRSLAVLHGAQGVLLLLLASSATFPVTANYLTQDSLASQAAGHPVLAAATRHLFDVNLAYLVVAFFFMSAIAHGLIATVYRKRYETDLSQGMNKARWIEYGISASTMIVAIALLTGVYDLGSLTMIFSLVLIMNLSGLMMEIHNQTTKKTNWLSYGTWQARTPMAAAKYQPLYIGFTAACLFSSLVLPLTCICSIKKPANGQTIYTVNACI